MIARMEMIGRFVFENKRGESDINGIASSHVETVVLLNRMVKPF